LNSRQRKDVKAVIRKYIGRDPHHIAVPRAISAGLVALGVVGDLAFTGGIFSAGTLLFGGTGLFAGISAEAIFKSNKLKQLKNAAGQTITGPHKALLALKTIEETLQKEFDNAVAVQKTGSQIAIPTKEMFYERAQEIAEDIEKLSPAFNVMAGKYMTGVKYKSDFLALDKISTAFALPPVTRKKSPKPLSETELLKQKLKAMQKEIDELKNPKPYILPKIRKVPPPASGNRPNPPLN